ncbi:MAG TPA: GntR family transcriptional regulator [Conexibacter sp.]|jgi:DNA-binding GntR family transcriptional regulator
MQHQYVSKIDMVTGALRELIQQGEFRAGEPLKQRDLAARFSVSATPVREALRRLESEGLVRHSPHSGATVVEVDYGATPENARIRAALEGLAAELAAEVATESDVAELTALNDELGSTREPTAVRDLNLRIHFRLYELADSPLLISLLRRLWSAFPLGPQVVRPVRESVAQHAAIIDAVRRHDADTAGRLTREHILQVASAHADGDGDL